MKEFERPVDEEVRGPGEVISEMSLGFNIKVLEGEMSTIEAQDWFNREHRNIILFSLRNPTFSWETGSTQVEPLQEKLNALRAERKANGNQSF